MASESTSPEDGHGHADGTASPPRPPFAPRGVSAQETGGGTNAGDSTATPLLQEVPQNGATASTIRAIPDDDDPPIPVWQVADHEKESKGPQLHVGPPGPQPFFSHEFDDSLAKGGGDDLEGPQRYDGLPGPPPCFPHEFDDSLAKRGRNAVGATPPFSPALVGEPGGIRAEPQGPRQLGTSRRRLPRESLVPGEPGVGVGKRRDDGRDRVAGTDAA
ncbi:hypothetical protein THAOC_14593 [Thalassiosira oceanica]|uniref:Uncharacterized protein n=1 Tax=Thalassiosira oceanica TaxID=159749 RepID=K0SH53_THAOC|nr:hypothetical protein THAOC_14593 [Thalassiosira oceanica]|eukprot:EJK64650.1 hypothetical protein THAOC_14593 [Thalassiosira oceanica]